MAESEPSRVARRSARKGTNWGAGPGSAAMAVVRPPRAPRKPRYCRCGAKLRRGNLGTLCDPCKKAEQAQR